MVRHWPKGGRKNVIVEFGPGTGSFTGLIHQLRTEEKYIGLELNDIFVEQLRKVYPSMEFCHRSAEALPKVLQERGLHKAQLIVSGLPWSIFSEKHQEEILQATFNSLDDTGVFSTFAYFHALRLPGARRFARLIKTIFPTVEVSRIVWRNLPPAVIYHCSKRNPFE